MNPINCVISDVNFIFAVLNPHEVKNYKKSRKLLVKFKEEYKTPMYKLMNSTEEIFISTYTRKVSNAYFLVLDSINKVNLSHKKSKNKSEHIDRLKKTIDKNLELRRKETDRNAVDLILSKFSLYSLSKSAEERKRAYNQFAEAIPLGRVELERFKRTISNYWKIDKERYNLSSYNQVLRLVKRKLESIEDKHHVLRDKNDDYKIISEFITWTRIYSKKKKFIFISSDKGVCNCLNGIKIDFSKDFEVVDFSK